MNIHNWEEFRINIKSWREKTILDILYLLGEKEDKDTDTKQFEKYLDLELERRYKEYFKSDEYIEELNAIYYSQVM